MSAVEEYRKECASRGLWPVPEDGSLLCIADAAIAALEAENRELQLDLKDVLKKRDLCETRHEQAEAELAALKQTGQEDHTPEREVVKLRDELALWQQAVGLASTCVPTMEIDVTDPIGMMQKVCAELAALKGRRCDGCKWQYNGHSGICWEDYPGFACNRWAARAEEGARMSDYLNADPEDYAEAVAWFNECKARRARDKARIAELEAEMERLQTAYAVQKAATCQLVVASATDYPQALDVGMVRAMEQVQEQRHRADRLQAELASLKGRRCETCLHWRGFIDMGLGVGDCEATKRFCITNQLHTPDTFACSWWAARAEEGGGE